MSQSRPFTPVLLGGALLLGTAFAAPAHAEELRIGFIAPMTGIFAQVGKDMNDGFQMYLEEHGNKLGGLDVKFRAGRRPGKAGPRRDQGKKLVLNDNRLSTRTGKHRTQNHLHPIDSGGGRPHATPGRQISLPDPHWLVSIAAPPCAWSLGLRSGLQENRHDRCRLCLRL
jgi:hypothetical protein